jgi:hypothetical protein
MKNRKERKKELLKDWYFNILILGIGIFVALASQAFYDLILNSVLALSNNSPVGEIYLLLLFSFLGVAIYLFYFMDFFLNNYEKKYVKDDKVLNKNFYIDSQRKYLPIILIYFLFLFLMIYRVFFK